MRILLSTSIVSSPAGHGGPVVAMRQANALARRGMNVRVVAPQVEEHSLDAAVSLERYEATATRESLARWCRDPHAVASLELAIERFAPDVVYDVHGPPWAVEAAARRSVPCVTMVGDFNWFCRRTFLVDHARRRCSGPGSQRKCFRCLNGDSAPRQALVRSALSYRPSAPLVEGVFGTERLAPHRLWERVHEADAYTAQVRSCIERFLVGDAHARDFLLRHGVREERMKHLPQCLPAGALRLRRVREPGCALPLKIGFVGRPHYDKGLHVLARAFDALPPGTRAELWIVHSRHATREEVAPMFPDERRFQTLVDSGKVRLMKPRGHEAIFDAMAQVDLACVPSLQFESPCLAMLEFVAQRTPVVRSESAGMQHVVQDGVNGRTFPYGDWRALRSILLDILDNPSVLAGWSARLPEIGNDETYASALEDLFTSLARPRVAAPCGAAA